MNFVYHVEGGDFTNAGSTSSQVKRMLKKIGVSPEIVKKTVVALYEAEVSTDGLCRFLVGPGRSAAPYILDALKEIHASRHADLLKKFTSSNGIDINDLSALAIDNSWDYEERKKMYPFDDFLKQFEKLYEKEPLDLRLMQYARNHIEEF